MLTGVCSWGKGVHSMLRGVESLASAETYPSAEDRPSPSFLAALAPAAPYSCQHLTHTAGELSECEAAPFPGGCPTRCEFSASRCEFSATRCAFSASREFSAIRFEFSASSREFSAIRFEFSASSREFSSIRCEFSASSREFSAWRTASVRSARLDASAPLAAVGEFSSDGSRGPGLPWSPPRPLGQSRELCSAGLTRPAGPSEGFGFRVSAARRVFRVSLGRRAVTLSGVGAKLTRLAKGCRLQAGGGVAYCEMRLERVAVRG
eukprot:384169-Prorocentrum_minimum.AAC.1